MNSLYSFSYSSCIDCKGSMSAQSGNHVIRTECLNLVRQGCLGSANVKHEGISSRTEQGNATSSNSDVKQTIKLHIRSSCVPVLHSNYVGSRQTFTYRMSRFTMFLNGMELSFAYTAV